MEEVGGGGLLYLPLFVCRVYTGVVSPSQEFARTPGIELKYGGKNLNYWQYFLLIIVIGYELHRMHSLSDQCLFLTAKKKRKKKKKEEADKEEEKRSQRRRRQQQHYIIRYH